MHIWFLDDGKENEQFQLWCSYNKSSLIVSKGGHKHYPNIKIVFQSDSEVSDRKLKTWFPIQSFRKHPYMYCFVKCEILSCLMSLFSHFLCHIQCLVACFMCDKLKSLFFNNFWIAKLCKRICFWLSGLAFAYLLTKNFSMLRRMLCTGEWKV